MMFWNFYSQFIIILIVVILSAHENTKDRKLIGVAGITTNLEIACSGIDTLDPVYWIINDKIYDLYIQHLPFIQLSSSGTITIPFLDVCLNDTTFQCMSSSSLTPIEGKVTLIVEPNPASNGSNFCNDELLAIQSPELFEVNTETLLNEGVYSTFEMHYPSFCNNNYSAPSLQIVNATFSSTNVPLSCCDANITSSEILSNENYVLHLHLNDSRCETQSRILFTSEGYSTKHTLHRNETLCLPFPDSTPLCSFSVNNFLNLAISTECIVPVNYVRLSDFSCYQTSQKYTITYNHTSNMPCLSDWNDNLNKTVVIFTCFGDTFRDRHYTYSHEIIIEDGTERQDRPITTTKLSSAYSSTSKPTEMFTTAKSREVPLNVIIPIVIAVIALVFVIVMLSTITMVLACLYITIREKYYKNLSFVTQNNILEDRTKNLK